MNGSLVRRLEGTGLQSETGCFIDTGHQIHVLYGLANGTLQQIVDSRRDEYLALEGIDMHQGLIGVHHLLQVDGLVAVMGEGGISVEIFVGFDDVLSRSLCLDDSRAENTAGKVTTVGNEVDVGIKVTLHLLDGLPDFCDVLMLEGFVDAQVVIAPREVGGGTGFLAGTRGASDGINADILLQQVQVGGRQQCHLNGSSKATRISHMLSLLDVFFVNLWQTVDVVVIALDTEVLCEVDNFHIRRDGVLLEKCLALAVTEAEEYDVDLVERHRVGKFQISLTDESFVHVTQQISCIAF